MGLLTGDRYVVNVGPGSGKPKRGGCGRLILWIAIAVVILAVVGAL